jgi:hypothetical protein
MNHKIVYLIKLHVMPELLCSVYYPKLLTPLLRRSIFNEEGIYFRGRVGARIHLGYGVPELPPEYS